MAPPQEIERGPRAVDTTYPLNRAAEPSSTRIANVYLRVRYITPVCIR